MGFVPHFPTFSLLNSTGRSQLALARQWVVEKLSDGEKEWE